MESDGCNNKTMTKLAMHTNIPQIKIGAFKKWAHKIKRHENMNTKPNAWEEYALGWNACQLLKFCSSKIEWRFLQL